MAKETEKDEILETKEDKKAAKLAEKKAKADEKKKVLAEEIADIKSKIADSSDEKEKAKLRKKRDELIKMRDAISTSKDGMTIPMAPQTKRIITSVVAVVCIVALLVTYVATGAVRHGFFATLGVPQSSLTGFTLTDKDGEKHSIKVSTYNYYFANLYNNLQSTQSTYTQYGMDLSSVDLDVDFDKKLSDQERKNDDGETVTWAEYMQEEVVESIKSTYTYYYEAVKANDGKEPKITEEQQKELDETLEQYSESAAGYGYELSGYLEAAMGKGVNEKVFRREATISYIASNFKEDYNDELLAKDYSDKELNAYRDEHKDELLAVDVKLFECDTEDDAKAFKKALNSDGSNFASLASKYSSEDWDKEAYKNAAESTYKDITKSTLQGLNYSIATADDKDSNKYPGLDKLFSAKAGDIIQYSNSIAYVIKGSHLPTAKVVNVRHILITPYFNDEDSDDDSSSKQATDATDKQWAAAKKQAEKVLKEFKNGDKTAENFGELAKEYSEDGNASTGGAYENVYPNQMVPTFNAWCFDSARKSGDTAIVKTQYGYHIIFFEGKSKLNAWQFTAQQALATEDGEDASSKLEKSYTIKTNWLGSRYFEKDTDIDA